MYARNPGVFWGVVLIVVGALLLLSNTHVLDNVNWSYVWPVALIALGLWLIARRIGWRSITITGRPAKPQPPPDKAEPPPPSS